MHQQQFLMTLERKISHINKIVKAYRSNKGFLEKNCFRKEKSKVSIWLKKYLIQICNPGALVV